MICAYGCLDENPKDQVDPDAIYNNADNIYKNAVASLYNYIGAIKSRKDFRAPAEAYTIITRSPQTRR